METEKDQNSIITEKIKQIRMKKGISQSKIAKALHITTAAYCRIENNQTQLTINNLYIICDELKTPIQEMLNIRNVFNAYNQGNVVMTDYNHGTLNLSIDLNEIEKIMNKKN